MDNGEWIMNIKEMTEEEVEKNTGFSIAEIGSLESMDAATMGKAMIATRNDLDQYKATKARYEKRYEWLRKHLPKKMEDEGIEKFTIDGKNIRIGSQLFASILKDNRLFAYDWLRSNGLGDIIVETVNSSTLKATVKEQMGQGVNFPEELFKVTLEEWAQFY